MSVHCNQTRFFMTKTPAEYRIGAVKQSPDGLAVAVRTAMKTSDGSLDWGVMTVANGGRYASWPQVMDWPDVVLDKEN